MGAIDIEALGQRAAAVGSVEDIRLASVQLYDEAVGCSRSLLAQHAVVVLGVREMLSLQVTGVGLWQRSQQHQTLPELHAFLDFLARRDPDAVPLDLSPTLTTAASPTRRNMFSQAAPLEQAYESLARLEREQAAYEAQQRLAMVERGELFARRSVATSRASSVQSLISDVDTPTC